MTSFLGIFGFSSFFIVFDLLKYAVIIIVLVYIIRKIFPDGLGTILNLSYRNYNTNNQNDNPYYNSNCDDSDSNDFNSYGNDTMESLSGRRMGNTIINGSGRKLYIKDGVVYNSLHERVGRLNNWSTNKEYLSDSDFRDY